MFKADSSFVLIHADESCLGNGRDGANPGGAGSLLEYRSEDSLEREDVFLSSPDTTNNKMALAGAIATFALLEQKLPRARVAYVSDSQYLIKGITEWLPNWRARGWRRKGGKIENLDLWKTLDRVCDPFEIEWIWVRGHAGHPKNEYVNDLAIQAATDGVTSDGAVPSGFDAWLAARPRRFPEYDPDAAFDELETRWSKRR